MKILLISLLFTIHYGAVAMIIKLPVMCGMSSHSVLYSKIDKAIEDKAFPIDLDCSETVFTTSMFCRFLVTIKQRVERAGGKVRLLNVDDGMYAGLQATSMDQLIEIMRKFNG